MSTIVRAVPPPIRLSRITLPVEHGSWGFLLEPLVAGIALAPSPAAPFIALFVVGAFLTRRPLQIFITQKRRHGSNDVIHTALIFVAAFGAFAFAGLIGSFFLTEPKYLLPLIVAAPLGIYQLYRDVALPGRDLSAEIAGALIMPTSAAALVLGGGSSPQFAFSVWFLFAARLASSILYVRSRLNLEKGKPFSRIVPVAMHIISLFGVALLVNAGSLPGLVLPVVLILLARSIFGLSRFRTKMKAMKIGVWEIIYGSLLVVALVVGKYTQF
jgi:hypothetical protein